MLHSVNVRTEQTLDASYRFIQLRTDQLGKLPDLVGEEFVFYQPRDRQPGAYLGFGSLLQVTPIHKTPYSLVEFIDINLFQNPVPLSRIYQIHDHKPKLWFEYAPPIQALSAEVAEVLRAERSLEYGLRETSDSPALDIDKTAKYSMRRALKRNLSLRFKVLNIYGPSCVFSHQNHTGIQLGHYATEVGHIIPLHNGGPDVITNALPMSPLTNWLWDEGVIGLETNGTILVHEAACADTKAFIRAGSKIPFIDARTWPRAEYISWHREHIYGRGPALAIGWHS